MQYKVNWPHFRLFIYFLVTTLLIKTLSSTMLIFLSVFLSYINMKLSIVISYVPLSLYDELFSKCHPMVLQILSKLSRLVIQSNVELYWIFVEIVSNRPPIVKLSWKFLSNSYPVDFELLSKLSWIDVELFSSDTELTNFCRNLVESLSIWTCFIHFNVELLKFCRIISICCRNCVELMSNSPIGI